MKEMKRIVFLFLIGLLILTSCQKEELENTQELMDLPISMDLSLNTGFVDSLLGTRALLTPGEVAADGEIFVLDSLLYAKSSLSRRATMYCPAMRNPVHRQLSAFYNINGILSFRLWNATSLSTAEFEPYMYHLDSRESQTAYLYATSKSTVDTYDVLESKATRNQNKFDFNVSHTGSKITILLNISNTDASFLVNTVKATFFNYTPSYVYTEDGSNYDVISATSDLSKIKDMQIRWNKSTNAEEHLFAHQIGVAGSDSLYNILLAPQNLEKQHIYVTAEKPTGKVLYTIAFKDIALKSSSIVGETRTALTEINSGEHVVIALDLNLTEQLTGYAAVCNWYDASASSLVDGSNVKEGEGLDSAGVNDIDYVAIDRVFRIYTARGLAVFRNIVNANNTSLVSGYSTQTVPNGLTDADARLMRDIDFATYNNTATYWSSIGNSAAQAYRGNFDGCGYTISNMKITDDDNSHGLFYYVGDGLNEEEKKELKNIRFIDVDINSDNDNIGILLGTSAANYVISDISVQGLMNNVNNNCVGGIAGQVNGNVDFINCTVEMPIKYTSSSDSCENIGGIVGKVGKETLGIADVSTFTDCKILSDIDMAGNVFYSNIGGLGGQLDASVKVENCTMEGLVTGSAQVGGLFGYVHGYLQITKSKMKKDVNCRNVLGGDSYWGGIIGAVDGDVEMDECEMSGKKVESGYAYTGGLIGNVGGNLKLTNCICDVCEISSKSYGGGLIGNIVGNAEINNCNAKSNVFGVSLNMSNDTTVSRLGGMIGSIGGEAFITDCHAEGEVKGGFRYLGGLIGNIVGFATITNSSAVGNVKKGDYAPIGEWFGGLVGFIQNGCDLKNCYTKGNVYGGHSNGKEIKLGGLIGEVVAESTAENSILSKTSINDCYALGNVKSFGGYYVGGLVGKADKYYVKILNCAAGCDLTGGQSTLGSRVESLNNGYYVGGIVGAIQGSLDGCSVAHEVYGSESGIGGIVGYLVNPHNLNTCDISISNCKSTGSVYGKAKVGGVTGEVGLYAKIDDCTSEGAEVGYYPKKMDNVTLGSVVRSYIGGLIGYASPHLTITRSKAGSSVCGVGSVGGLIGFVGEISNKGSYLTMEDCHATGDVVMCDYISGNAEFYYSAGGLIGSTSVSYNITNCDAIGSVNSVRGNVGGLIGSGHCYNGNFQANSTILNCYATGNVKGKSQYIGGLIGRTGGSSMLKNSYATGDVIGTSLVGGLVGYLSSSDSLVACYAGGSVMGTETGVGGLIGKTEAISGKQNKLILACYSTGKRVSANGIDVGGLCGFSEYADWLYCYSLAAVSSEAENVGGLFGTIGTLQGIVVSCYATGGVVGESSVGALVGHNGKNVKWYDCASPQYNGITLGVGSFNNLSDVTNFTNTNNGILPANIRDILETESIVSPFEINGVNYTAKTIWSNDVTPKLPW